MRLRVEKSILGLLGLSLLVLCGCQSSGGISEAGFAVFSEKLGQTGADVAFYQNMYLCTHMMHLGEYPKALPYCQTAGSIRPDDDEFQILMQMFYAEYAEDEALPQISEAEHVYANTVDSKALCQLADAGNVSHRDDCESYLYQKIETNEADTAFYRSLYHCMYFTHIADYDTAEPYCNIAGSFRPGDSDYLMSAQIFRSESQAYRTSDFFEELGSDDSKENYVVDVTALCKQGVQAKIKKKNCEAYQLYQKALSMGVADATCTRNANKHISDFKNECKDRKIKIDVKSVTPRPSVKQTPQATHIKADVSTLCKKAVQARIKKKNCEAYKLYKKALSIGGADSICTRNANKHISDFKNACDGKKIDAKVERANSHTDSHNQRVHAAVKADVSELCKKGVQAKIKKNNCEAYKFYKKALKTGGADATCTRNAEKHISNFKKECD